MTTPLKPTTVTYGDLRDGDTIVDKSGNEWLVSQVAKATTPPADIVAFWLGSPPQHLVNKPSGDPVTVLRPESHAEELSRLEDEAPPTAGEAIAQVAEAFAPLGAEVIAEESAVESDARRTAEATGEPVTLPTFADMTDLEKRSHLYLIHGVYAADVKFREKLLELHEEAHAGDADRVPHTHVAEMEVSS